MRLCDPIHLTLVDVNVKLVMLQNVAWGFINNNTEACQPVQRIDNFCWKLIRYEFKVDYFYEVRHTRLDLAYLDLIFALTIRAKFAGP